MFIHYWAYVASLCFTVKNIFLLNKILKDFTLIYVLLYMCIYCIILLYSECFLTFTICLKFLDFLIVSNFAVCTPAVACFYV